MKMPRIGRARRRNSVGVTSRKKYVALGVAVLFILGSFVFAFGKQSLFGGGYEVRAVFRDASQLRGGSEVRIAGVAIGRVIRIEADPSTNGALVTMKIKPGAPPIRVQDRMTVKPRLAFEGNFYIDVATGDPNAPKLQANDTVPASLTASTVQLDEVLTTFDTPVRDSAKSFIGSIASGLGVGTAPTGSLATGAQGLREATRELDGSLLAISRTSRAVRGTDPGDLTRALRSAGDLTTTLAKNPAALSSIVSNYANVVGNLAASDRDLSRTIGSADSFLGTAPSSLRRIDALLPPLRTFSDAVRPALRDLPGRLPALNYAFAQVATVALPGRLDTLVKRLRYPVENLPTLEKQLKFILPDAAPIGRCLTKTVIPALQQDVPDGPLTLGQPVWLQLLHAFAAFGSASQGFDANGATLRLGLNEGDNSLFGSIPSLSDNSAIAGGGDILGVSPQWLGTGIKPLKRVDQECEDQKVPDLSIGTQAKPFEGLGSKRVSPATTQARGADTIDALKASRDAIAKRLGDEKKPAATTGAQR